MKSKIWPPQPRKWPLDLKDLGKMYIPDKICNLHSIKAVPAIVFCGIYSSSISLIKLLNRISQC